VNAETETRSSRIWEITVESDWFTTLGAAVLFIVSGLLLVWEIDHFILGHLSGPVRLHRSFWSIWNKVFEAIAAICCFIFAFTLPKKSVKIASLLMGINLAGFVLLSCFHISPGVRHIAAVSGSAMRQVALAIFCVALAQWLRSVVRWGRQSELGGGES
jgi:hypothetical protein